LYDGSDLEKGGKRIKIKAGQSPAFFSFFGRKKTFWDFAEQY